MISRATIRKQFAQRLSDNMSSVVAHVYDYQVGDFKGQSPVLVVTGGGTDRGDSTTSADGTIGLEVHSFVLYSLPSLQATNDPEDGLDVEIEIADTSPFTVGQVVVIEDDANSELAVISVVTEDVSFTVEELVNAYTAPRIFVWTEEMSEDRIDLLEMMIAEQVILANDDDTWLKITRAGQSEIDVVDLGGEAYRHEMIPIAATIQDF